MAMPNKLTRAVRADLETGETPLAGLMVITWPLFTYAFITLMLAIVVWCVAVGATARTFAVALAAGIMVATVGAGLWVRSHTEVGSLFAGIAVTDRRLLVFPTSTQLGMIQPVVIDVPIGDVRSVTIDIKRPLIPRTITIEIHGHRRLSVTGRLLGRPDEFVSALRDHIV